MEIETTEELSREHNAKRENFRCKRTSDRGQMQLQFRL